MQFVFPDMDVHTRYRLRDYRDNLILFLAEAIENNIYKQENSSVADAGKNDRNYMSHEKMRNIVSEIYCMSQLVDQDRVYNVYNIEDVIKEIPGGKN